jgi:hypothetical protein
MQLPKHLAERVELLKKSGYRGGIIGAHRARTSIPFTAGIFLSIMLIPIFYTAVLWNAQDHITLLWYAIFEFWFDKLNINGDININNYTILFQPLVFPYPHIYTGLPTTADMIWCGVSVIVCFLAGFILMQKFAEKNLIPLAYLFRIFGFINLCTIIFFLIRPEGYFFGVDDYIRGCLSVGYIYLYLLSPILAFTYNIFSMKLRYKLLIPFAMIGYFLIFLPHLFLFHALILLKFSILYLPLLYLMFTFLPVMAMTVGIYAFFLGFNAIPQSEFDN